ncbi:MAG: hypothetical protein KDA73_01470 [Rhodobacteraceae bacterium]|nr:hypothetical protein [Paracoccaceae bacterium]
MALISDILLIAAALGAAFYCLVLSRRLSRFTSLEDGVGGAVAGLSQQVAEMTHALDRAHGEARASAGSLEESTRRAEAAARKLELLLASLHDLPAREREEPDAVAPAKPQAQSQTQPQPAGPTFRRSFGASRREAAE